MLESTPDVAHPDGYIRYSRGVALTRLALVGAFVLLLAEFTPWRITALGAVEFALYLALLVATEAAMRSPDRQRASRRLRIQADILMLLLVANACWLALIISDYGKPKMQVEAALIAICVLLFAALRVHMSRLSYLVGVAPPAATLLWIALHPNRPPADNHFALAMALFVAAVLLVTWRQLRTDRALSQALRDLTRKNLALAQAMHEASMAAGARSRLLAMASHEVRTPLNAVMGFAQALLRQPLTPVQAGYARGAQEGAEHLARLLDGILDLAAAGSEEAPLNPAPLDMRRLVSGAVALWRGQAQALSIDLAFEDADPGLSYAVVADGAKIEQMLVALISNALRATPGRGRVGVRLAGVDRGDSLGVLVEVRDTGPPLSSEDRERAFEAFGDTARGRFVGDTGFSLAAAAAALARMGGQAGVDDPAPEWGVGAAFWFAFEAPRQASPASVEAGPLGVTRTIRVLAAEDNAANRRVLAALMEALPVALTFAEDGAEAVAAWRGGAFDLVLMDANMPVMDGVEALREIRRAEPADAWTPVWMLTANVSQEDMARYEAAGASGVLRKPLDAGALYALLGDVAARASDEVRPS